MPPTDPTPAVPQEGNNPPKKPGEIDLDAILLPTKDVPPQSGERVNAGILFEQEQNASLPKPDAAPVAPPPPKNTSIVKPLQTFKGDIENLIQDKNVSMVTIAAAEAEKRAQASAAETEEKREPSGILVFLRKFLMIIGGLALLAVAGGLGIYTYMQMTATVDVPVDTPAPFITVDKTTVVAQPQSNLTRAPFMQALENAKNSSVISLGLIDRLLPAATTQGTEGEVRTAIPAALFLPIIAPTIPDELVRTLAQEFLLGIHIFDGPQAFLILHTDSYERAFAAMLAWEPTLQEELTPLFDRDLVPTNPPEPLLSTDIASSTASSTPQAPARPPRPTFVDKIVENRDTRVILNEAGEILLLWTFLDRNTLVITTNEYTLREIVTRLSAPVTPAP